MSLYKDFVNFVDGNSPVPYHVDGAKYVYKPNITSEVFEYEFKIFYKSYNKYYVGVAFSQFVRPISASDFNLIKKLKADSCTYSRVVKAKQLVFNF